MLLQPDRERTTACVTPVDLAARISVLRDLPAVEISGGDERTAAAADYCLDLLIESV